MNKFLKINVFTVFKRITTLQTYNSIRHLFLQTQQKHNLISNHVHRFAFSSKVSSDAGIPLSKLDTKKLLSFVCKKCKNRNTKFISKQAYEKGVVIVRCEGCENNHLIADNLNWFQLGEVRNIEDILAEKGETVTKELSHDGSLEVILNKKNLDN